MIEVRCMRQPWRDGVEVAILDRGHKTFVAAPLTMVEIEEGAFMEPALSLTNQAAQGLMDELWRCGLRPSEGSGSAGSLAATERHLKDMQTIAMGALKQKGMLP